MSRYVSILSVQGPTEIGSDDNSRVMFSTNFDCEAVAPVASFMREIIKLLNTAGLATIGVDIFVGPDSVVPDGDGPYINLTNTGGESPIETHNGSKYERLSVQVIVRAEDYEVAEARALAVWRELDGKRNVTVAA